MKPIMEETKKVFDTMKALDGKHVEDCKDVSKLNKCLAELDELVTILNQIVTKYKSILPSAESKPEAKKAIQAQIDSLTGEVTKMNDKKIKYEEGIKDIQGAGARATEQNNKSKELAKLHLFGKAKKFSFLQKSEFTRKRKSSLKSTTITQTMRDIPFDKINDIGGEVGKCLQAFTAAVPPSFCFKKGLDFGYIPTKCKAPYSFRSLALCYKPCTANENFVAGVCWGKCASGETDIGAICCTDSCWKVWKWKAKSSYIADSVTNFNKDYVECDKPAKEEYKAGALCYRNCEKLGLQNCGIGACSVDGMGCLGGIMDMAVDVISGVAQAVAFVASLGASSAGTPFLTALKTNVKSKLTSFIKGGVKGAFDHAKNI